jgi:hypothetical protein
MGGGEPWLSTMAGPNVFGMHLIWEAPQADQINFKVDPSGANAVSPTTGAGNGTANTPLDIAS